MFFWNFNVASGKDTSLKTVLIMVKTCKKSNDEEKEHDALFTTDFSKA